VEFLEVDCWDTPAEIGNWKFVIRGGNPVRFIDGESSDWTAWKKTSSGVPQTFIIGPTGYCYLSKLGYGGSYQDFIDTFDAIAFGDEDPPYVDSLNPDDGATGVNLNANIKGHVKDDNWGVDEESVIVEGSVFSRDDIEGTLTLTGGFFDFAYSLNPDDDLPHYAEISVYVAAEDLAGYDVEYEYSFWTRSFELQEPDDGDVIEVIGRGGGAPEHGALSGNLTLSPGSGTRTDVDVTFEWEEVVRAESYELIVDDNDDFSSPEVDVTDITDPEYTYTFDVTDDVTYYWYVICNAPDADFDSEDTFSFSFDYNTNIAPASLGQIKAGFAE
jgi:hypothetical protein